MNIIQSKKNNNKSTEDKQSIKSNVRAQEIDREKAGGGVWGKYEFKGHKCLSSNGHYFLMAHLFTEIFNSLDSQQSKEKIWSKNMIPYYSPNKADFAKLLKILLRKFLKNLFKCTLLFNHTSFYHIISLI